MSLIPRKFYFLFYSLALLQFAQYSIQQSTDTETPTEDLNIVFPTTISIVPDSTTKSAPFTTPSKKISPLNPSNTTTQANYNGLIQPSPKIFGIGWALFLCLFFGSIGLLACLAYSQDDTGGIVVAGTIAAMTLLVGILIAIPKVPVGTPVETPTLLDWSYHPRIAFAVFSTVLGFGSMSFAFITYLFTPVYAIKPDEE